MTTTEAEQNTRSYLISANDVELDMQKVDPESLADVYSKRTMIQCGICSICKSENMPLDCAPGTACRVSTDSLPMRIVHCENKNCIASARYVFNRELFLSNRFFVSNTTALQFFTTDTLSILRSDGSFSNGKIDWHYPFRIDRNLKIRVVCSIEDGELLKEITLESLLQYNEKLRNQWQSAEKFKVAYELQMIQTKPSLLIDVMRFI